MSDDRRDSGTNIALPARDTSVEEPSGPERRGKRDRRRTEPMDPSIKAAIRAGRLHRKQFEPSRDHAKRMAKAYRVAIVPRRKPGVEALDVTVTGAEAYQRGLEEYAGLRPNTPWNKYRDRCIWPAVYRATISGFDKMDLADRQYYSTRVRSNVKAYLGRRGVKLSPGKRNRRHSRRGNRGESNTPD